MVFRLDLVLDHFRATSQLLETDRGVAEAEDTPVQDEHQAHDGQEEQEVPGLQKHGNFYKGLESRDYIVRFHISLFIY